MYENKEPKDIPQTPADPKDWRIDGNSEAAKLVNEIVEPKLVKEVLEPQKKVVLVDLLDPSNKTDPKILEEINLLIKKNIGRNRWRWLRSIGCIIESDKCRDYYQNENYYNICTKQGNYIGLLNLRPEHQWAVKLIYSYRLNQLRGSREDTTGAVGIGYSTTKKGWMGWTHRGRHLFQIGYKVVEGSIMDCGAHKYPFEAKTLDDCKRLAIDLSSALD